MLVVPVYDMIVTPESTVYFELDQIKRSAGGREITSGEKAIIIVAKQKENFKEMTEESFYPIGVSGVVSDVNVGGYVAINVQYRVSINDIWINPNHTIELTVSKRNDIDDLDKDIEEEKLKNLLQEMRDFSKGFEWAEWAEHYIGQIETIGMAAASMSPWLKI